MMKRYARRISDYKGRPVYEVPVIVHLNDSHRCATVAEIRYSVISHRPEDACNYIRDLFRHRAETEVYAWGVKGGQVYRYVGWESAIWGAMNEGWDERRAGQGRLPFEE